ncbi:MAG: hypothetical protein JNM13_15230 [Hyphomicrobiaceae bacterium]|nr:hypothetical protein [Hyphomicrobiaceae bacterium]
MLRQPPARRRADLLDHLAPLAGDVVCGLLTLGVFAAILLAALRHLALTPI